MNMQYKDVAALQSLKYFTQSSRGTLRLRKDVASRIIDAHTHIGWGMRPLLETDPTAYVFPFTGAHVTLSQYSAHDFTKPLTKRARQETVKAVLAKGRNFSCSAAHLERDMQDLNIASSIVLAVDIFGTINSDMVLQTAQDSNKIFTPFISLHPRKKHNDVRMKDFVARGAKGMKIHPPMQLVRPSSTYVCSMMELATFYHLPVLFHCGFTPLSPRWQKRFSVMEDYEKIVSWYTKTPIILGHTGIDEWEKAVEIARKYEHVYLELSGQPPQVIKKIIQVLGDDRVMFGSDWPYYPTALPLAKVLLATEGKESTRERLLYGNAHKLLLQRSR